MALLRRHQERGAPVVVRLCDRPTAAGQQLHHLEVPASAGEARCGVQRGATVTVRERQRRPKLLCEVNHHPEQPTPRGMPQRGPPVAVLAIDFGAHREQLPEHRPDLAMVGHPRNKGKTIHRFCGSPEVSTF